MPRLLSFRSGLTLSASQSRSPTTTTCISVLPKGTDLAGRVQGTLAKLPPLEGRQIRLSFRRSLRSHRGRLFSGAGEGIEVHAGSELRKRAIVLDEDLLVNPAELRRILFHEVAHFVWVRLSNRVRASYENVLAIEFKQSARGELGWSSESRKAVLAPREISGRTLAWRRYVCESFCDTAAWFFSGLDQHEEFTLAQRFRRRRRIWLAAELGARAQLAV